jgi:hypothetical protein
MVQDCTSLYSVLSLIDGVFWGMNVFTIRLLRDGGFLPKIVLILPKWMKEMEIWAAVSL